MAKARSKTAKKTRKPGPVRRLLRGVRRWMLRGVLVVAVLIVLMVLGYRVINPPTTIYIVQEARRLGGVDRQWVPLEAIAPVMARSVVAAEDANFCAHWGFDMAAIRDAIEDGGSRGASTISQQVVKNVYLWHGRNYARKAMEALLTPLVELSWPKARIIEVYLNVAEFDEGVFGIEAAARHYFGVGPEELSAVQAARLAAILPDPKGRSASRPSTFVRRRAASVMDGAETIRRDGRAACFDRED